MNPGRWLERPLYLTGLYYRSPSCAALLSFALPIYSHSVVAAKRLRQVPPGNDQFNKRTSTTQCQRQYKSTQMLVVCLHAQRLRRCPTARTGRAVPNSIKGRQTSIAQTATSESKNVRYYHLFQAKANHSRNQHCHQPPRSC